MHKKVDSSAINLATIINRQKQVNAQLPFTITFDEYLDPEQKEYEVQFAEEINHRIKNRSLLREYRNCFGRIINTDNTRQLFSLYGPGEIAPNQETKKFRQLHTLATHKPASKLTQYIWQCELARVKNLPEKQGVLFTAGGTGAGKTTSLKTVDTDTKQYDLYYDGNLNNLPKAIKKIDEALAVGEAVTIVYIYRHIMEALENGTLPRAERTGRTVPINAHLETHQGALETIINLLEHYQNDKRVTIGIIDNSLGRGNAKQVELKDFIKKQVEWYKEVKRYTKNDFEKTIRHKLGISAETKQGSLKGIERLAANPSETESISGERKSPPRVESKGRQDNRTDVQEPKQVRQKERAVPQQQTVEVEQMVRNLNNIKDE